MEIEVQEFECVQGNIHWFHGAKLIGPDGQSPEDEMRLAIKSYCHILVDHISDDGLSEVLQSLVEFYDYYKPSNSPVESLPLIHEMDAFVSSRVVRPSFSFEGD